jgi:hypothetical protein
VSDAVRDSAACSTSTTERRDPHGLQLRDFYGVNTPNPPVTRVHCPLLAWFGTKEPEIGTAADLELLKSTLQRLPTGPSPVDTVMIQNADHCTAAKRRK